MSTYTGYNTNGQYRKFTLTDADLITRDLINAFNIRPGEMPGRPGYGCGIWNLVFENYDSELEQLIKTQITDIANRDPRLAITQMVVYPNENTVIAEISFTTTLSVAVTTLTVKFDQASKQATQV
jgi:phage baseplate assembly protein W